MRTFDFDGEAVTINPHAAIQHGTVNSIQAVLDQYPLAPFLDRELMILEFDWRRGRGPAPTTPIVWNGQARYDFDPTSRAKLQNQKVMPFVLVRGRPRVKEISVYLAYVSGKLQIVRAHYGRPFPPAPWQSSAASWPGHKAGLLDLKPGVEGCMEFWRDHALVTKDASAFAQMSSVKPDWLS